MRSKGTCDGKNKVRFRLYLELDVDVWVEMLPKIYYKSCIPFICERK